MKKYSTLINICSAIIKNMLLGGNIPTTIGFIDSKNIIFETTVREEDFPELPPNIQRFDGFVELIITEDLNIYINNIELKTIICSIP